MTVHPYYYTQQLELSKAHTHSASTLYLHTAVCSMHVYVICAYKLLRSQGLKI